MATPTLWGVATITSTGSVSLVGAVSGYTTKLLYANIGVGSATVGGRVSIEQIESGGTSTVAGPLWGAQMPTQGGNVHLDFRPYGHPASATNTRLALVTSAEGHVVIAWAATTE